MLHSRQPDRCTGRVENYTYCIGQTQPLCVLCNRLTGKSSAQISDPEISVVGSQRSVARSVLFHGVWLWSQTDLWLWFPPAEKAEPKSQRLRQYHSSILWLLLILGLQMLKHLFIDTVTHSCGISCSGGTDYLCPPQIVSSNLKAFLMAVYWVHCCSRLICLLPFQS